MKLTFTMLFACWTIYSSCSNNICAVLSLPPSLIASAASLQQQYNTKTATTKTATTDQDLNELWGKDVATTAKFKGGNNTSLDIINAIQKTVGLRPPSSSPQNNKAHQRKSRMAKIASSTTGAVSIDPRSMANKANKPPSPALSPTYDLNGYLQAAKAEDDDMNSDSTIYDGGGVGLSSGGDGIGVKPLLPPLLLPATLISPIQLQQHQQKQQQQQQQRENSARADANEFFTPLKYWARHCQPDKNCPQQYYRALLTTNRNLNKETPLILHPNIFNANNEKLKNFGGVDDGDITAVTRALYDDLDVIVPPHNSGNIDNYDDDEITDKETEYEKERQQKLNNDIFMFLNGQQDIIKFLRWAMEILYPHERFANYSASGADFYHPGMYIWKKLNLSGGIQPPLFAEEPHYLIVRREQLGDDFKSKSKYNNDDPFIPPRGRKHNMPDLDALLHRYETFVPNRGRRDKIKDMLKSDDLFFPNRGKRLKAATTNKRDMEYENGNINRSSSNKNSKNNDDNSNIDNIVDNIENESSSYNVNNVDDNDDHNNSNDNDNSGGIFVDDSNERLPLALIMRDTLAKLWQKKLQNQYKKLQETSTATSTATATGNKITKNAHEINYSNDNKNNPEWLQAKLNYKFNGYDPTGIKQSMPMAMAINGETREMSTPSTKNDALMQLMLWQPVQNNDNDYGNVENNDDVDDKNNNDYDVDDEIATGYRLPPPSVTLLGLGVDSNNVGKVSANRLLSTRSMSTAMAHRRQQQFQLQQRQRQQQQQQRQRHLQELRHLATISQELNGNVENEQEDQNFQHASTSQKQQQKQQQHHHHNHHYDHQVKSFANLVPLLSQQLQLQNNNEADSQHFQQKRKQSQQPYQPGFWPQEALRYSLLSKAQRLGLKGIENNANYNDYNYFDI